VEGEGNRGIVEPSPDDDRGWGELVAQPLVAVRLTPVVLVGPPSFESLILRGILAQPISTLGVLEHAIGHGSIEPGGDRRGGIHTPGDGPILGRCTRGGCEEECLPRHGVGKGALWEGGSGDLQGALHFPCGVGVALHANHLPPISSPASPLVPRGRDGTPNKVTL
jgi:hypothetical protein